MSDNTTRRFFVGAAAALSATQVWGANDRINGDTGTWPRTTDSAARTSSIVTLSGTIGPRQTLAHSSPATGSKRDASLVERSAT